MTILISGGLGFIGSHTCVELIENGYDIVIADNLSNSDENVLNTIQILTGKNDIPLYKVDLVNYEKSKEIFEQHNIDAVIHFAGLKAVSESIQIPIKYYMNNLVSTLNLLQLCEEFNVNKFIFSSSATVYGSSISPLNETSRVGEGMTNPYGKTKYFCEHFLSDFAKVNKNIKIIPLRYFNPVGAHKSGLLGEDPNDIPNNLMPFVIRVGAKNNIDPTLPDAYNELKIFGSDYDTIDGTGVRDFIHVVDLAQAHVKALQKLDTLETNYEVYNIGTGKGVSVLELVTTFAKVNNIKLPYSIVGRREGDLGEVFCTSSKAKNELGWETQKTLEDVCWDSYNFAKNKYKVNKIN